MKFTIFTPTFNRKELLEKLYKSLQKQTFKDFEWLIVDDGSADGTKEKVEEFLSEKRLDINSERIISQLIRQMESFLYALILMMNMWKMDLKLF